MDEYVRTFRRSYRDYADLLAPRLGRRLLEVTSPDDPRSLLRLPHVAAVGEDRGLGPELIGALVGARGPGRTAAGAHLDLRAIDAASAMAAVCAAQAECEFPHFEHVYHVVSVFLPPCAPPALCSRLRQMSETGYARLFVSAPPDAPRELLSGFLVVRCPLPSVRQIERALVRFIAAAAVPAAADAAALARGCGRCVHAALLWLRGAPAGSRPSDPVEDLCEELLEAADWDVHRLTSFAARAAARGVGVGHLCHALAARADRLRAPAADVIALGAEIDAETSVMARAAMRNVHYHMERFAAFVVGFGDIRTRPQRPHRKRDAAARQQA